MKVWDDLFRDGAYASAEQVLSGLGLEDVSAQVQGLPHSIYQELWHITKWQTSQLEQDAAAAKHFHAVGKFPAEAAPQDEAAWQRLLAEFMSGLEQGKRLAADEAALDVFYFNNRSRREVLEFLAVHNAYHLARIVMVRQLLGRWTPT